MLLTLLLIVPFIGIFGISTGMSYQLLDVNRIKKIALTTAIINLFISLIIFILFDFSNNQFQFVQEYHEISTFDFYLGLDGLSIYFVLLTTIITPIALLSNWNSIHENVRSYVIIILLLETLLLAVFLVLFYSSLLLLILLSLIGCVKTSSPPKPQTFVSLPLQSVLGLVIYNFLCNPKVIAYRFLILFTVGTFFKSSLSVYFGIPYTTFDFFFTTYMSSVGVLLADIYVLLPSPLALYNYFVHGKNIFSGLELPRYFKMEGPSGGSENLPLFSSQDKTSEGGGSKEHTVSNKIHQRIIDSVFTDGVKQEYNKFNLDMEKIANSLKKRIELLDKGKISLNNPEVPHIIIMMLQDQTRFINGSIMCRIGLVKVTLPSLPTHIKTELVLIETEINKLHEDLNNSIAKVRNIKDDKQQTKVFFNDLNAYRNKIRKEILKYETVSRDAFRKNLPDLYKMKEFKQLVNIEAPKSIKQVVDEDGYLKKRISEIINASNK